MKKIIALSLALLMFTATLCSCGNNATDLMDGIEGKKIVVDTKAESNAAVTDFAVRLFKESLEDGKNSLISPLSVLVALSMTANGADGNTLTQMESVLGMPVEDLNEWALSYMNNLPTEDKYKLHLANSIWFIDDGRFTVSRDFLQKNKDYYDAELYGVPFDQTTLDAINAWVKDETDGMIKNILDEIPADAVMYLVNALAFDAEWHHIYKKSEIGSREFITEDSTRRIVEMMYSTESKYLKDKNATGFIKYYADHKYAFAALLPDENTSVADYAASLDGEKLTKLLANVENTSVRAGIPKFETEYSVGLVDILKNMGMTDVFDSSVADLSKLGTCTDGNLYVNRVIHKTFISVDEKGTKAGAATAVEVNQESAVEIIDQKEVILDRPFVYMLIDCENNIPFFIGTMMDVE